MPVNSVAIETNSTSKIVRLFLEYFDLLSIDIEREKVLDCYFIILDPGFFLAGHLL